MKGIDSTDVPTGPDNELSAPDDASGAEEPPEST
jgi:hypothetical protein